MLALTTASYLLRPDIEETAMITMDFGDTNESWLMPAYGKQRDLVVVGSEKTAKIDYLKPQELEVFDIRIAEQDFDGKTAFSVENEGSYTIPIPTQPPRALCGGTHKKEAQRSSQQTGPKRPYNISNQRDRAHAYHSFDIINGAPVTVRTARCYLYNMS